MKCLAVSYFHMGKPHTIIGAERFHYRVRDGIGWFPLAIATKQNRQSRESLCSLSSMPHRDSEIAWVLYGQASRAISTGQLHALLRFHTRPINLVVFEGPSGISRIQGDLILGEASRLDAFSGYPVRT